MYDLMLLIVQSIFFSGMASIGKTRSGYRKQCISILCVSNGHLPPLSYLWKQSSQITAIKRPHILVMYCSNNGNCTMTDWIFAVSVSLPPTLSLPF